MISVWNLSEIPLNRRTCILNSISTVTEVRESRNTFVLECNVEGSGGELKMKKGVELSRVVGGAGVEILGHILSPTWSSKFSGSTPAPLHLDNVFFSMIACRNKIFKPFCLFNPSNSAPEQLRFDDEPAQFSEVQRCQHPTVAKDETNAGQEG